MYIWNHIWFFFHDKERTCFRTMLLVCYLHAKITCLPYNDNYYEIYTYVKITSCWYQMYVELLGDYVFSLMHLYKCMNVMFIVLIFLVWLSITIFEVALLWLLYYNQSKLLLILCGSRIADGGNELYSLLAIKIFKATGYLRWCTGRNSATLRLIGNRLSC